MSTLIVTNVQNIAGDGAAQLYEGTAKAWAQSSDAAVVNDSLNVTSGTDNGTGDYSYALTTALTSVNYSLSAGTWSNGTRVTPRNVARHGAGTAAIYVLNGATVAVVDTIHEFMVMGDLA